MTRTSYQQHARIMRKIINFDEDRNSTCAWDDCDRDSVSLYVIRQHEHAASVPCDSSLAKHPHFAFCTERHKLFFLNCMGVSARVAAEEGRKAYGMLPAGSRGIMG